jgi:hypothetical protein
MAVPVIDTLSPTTAIAGTGGDLTVIGKNYTASSQVLSNNIALATTFLSATQLKAYGPGSTLPGTYAIKVSDPVGGVSNIVNFVIQSNPTPVVLTSLDPAAMSVPGPPEPVTLKGSGFKAGVQLLLDGVIRAVSYVDSTTLLALLPGDHAVGTSQVQIRVGNQVSNFLPFDFVAAAPPPWRPPPGWLTVNYKRPTGQPGEVRMPAHSVVAVGSIDHSQCSVLLTSSGDWLTLLHSAEDFLDLVAAALEEETPTWLGAR